MAKEIDDKKFDWFPFYTDRFLVGTTDWHDEEIGVYIRLLVHQWRKKSILNDKERIINLTRIRDMAKFETVWSFVSEKFPVSPDGNLRNPVLEEVRQEQMGKAEGKKKRAKAAADARWGNVELPFKDPIFETEWKRWKEYKRVQHKFTYKSEDSEATALKGLFKLCNNDLRLALLLIDNAIEKGWKGIYDLPANYKSKSLSSPHELGKQDYQEKL